MTQVIYPTFRLPVRGSQRQWFVCPPVVYRYMDQEYIDEFFQTGRLRLSSFLQFSRHADEQRGDSQEGRNIVELIGNNLTLVAGTGHGHDAFIFCTSTRQSRWLMKKFNSNGYFRINDSPAFGQAILRALAAQRGLEGFCSYRGHVIRRDVGDFSLEAFRDATGSYDGNSIMNAIARHSWPDVFFSKRRRFSHQCEYRFVWIMGREVSDWRFVECPQALQYCEKITGNEDAG